MGFNHQHFAIFSKTNIEIPLPTKLIANWIVYVMTFILHEVPFMYIIITTLLICEQHSSVNCIETSLRDL